MTHRERLLAVFERQTLDQLPWLADLTYWHAAAGVRGMLKEEYRGSEGQRILCHDLGVCAYYGNGVGPAVCRTEGIKHETVEKDGLSVDRLECDGHVLEQHRRWLPESYCHAVTKYYVTEPSQLALVREMFARRQWSANPSPDGPLTTMGGDGLPICGMIRSPLPALLADWVGVQGTIFLMADAPEEVEATLEVIDRSNDGYFDHLSNTAAPLCHFADNLSADVIGGYWDSLCAEYYRRRVAQVHAAGKFCVSHLDGATRGLIARLAASGLDGIESLTPQPVGDITMEEMSRLMEPHDCVFWGGLPGAMFAHPWHWDALREMIDGLFRLHRSGRRVVVGSADQVPPDANLENVRKVGEYLAELGA